MNSSNFRSALQQRNKLVHDKAVYTEIVEHLTKFIDTDAVKAKTGIRSEGENPVVPQDNISSICDEFRKTIEQLDNSIEQIESSVVVNEKNKQEPVKQQVEEKVVQRPDSGRRAKRRRR